MAHSRLKLLALINADNAPATPLSDTNVTLSAPVADAGETHNTKVTVTAIAGQSYTGSQDLFYRRMDLASFAGLPFAPGQFTTPQSVINALNARNGTDLDLTDVQAFTVPDDSAMAEGDYLDLMLTAAATSYAWIGAVTISIYKPITAQVDVEDAYFEEIVP